LSLARGDKATVRLATLFQMTFPGAPCIYYGDEIALRGTDQYDQPHEDRDARWPFPWHDRSLWDMDLLTYFREIIALRHAHPVLRHGSYDTLWARDHCIAFARSDGTETLVVAINAGEHAAQLQLSASACPGSGVALDTLFGPASSQTLQGSDWNPIIPPRSGIVWQRHASAP
jgi:cyclomaltodextrinase / maltogenic alpha-amylase / neopullulanase